MGGERERGREGERGGEGRRGGVTEEGRIEGKDTTKLLYLTVYIYNDFFSTLHSYEKGDYIRKREEMLDYIYDDFTKKVIFLLLLYLSFSSIFFFLPFHFYFLIFCRLPFQES